MIAMLRLSRSYERRQNHGSTKPRQHYGTSKPIRWYQELPKLIESARQSTSTGQVQGTGQVLAELAYKLTQVAGQCSDPILLKDSICSLLDALDGLRRSISDRR